MTFEICEQFPNKHWGRSVRRVRHLQHLTLHEISAGTGLSVEEIQNLEKDRNISDETLDVLCKGLKVTLDLLIAYAIS